MPRDVDEDLIEATIRRVAEAKAHEAAQEAAPNATAYGDGKPSPESAAEAPLPAGAANEDRIAATIRRVEAEKAARNAAPSGAGASADAEHDSLVEATIRRVQAEKAARKSHPANDDMGSDDPIEATIRRVEAEKASRESAPPTAAGFIEEQTDDPIEATIRRVQAEKAARASEPHTAELDIEEQTDDPIEATIRRVQAEKSAREAAESVGESGEVDGTAGEDPIEATIRRVQAEKSAREAAESGIAPSGHDDVPGDDPIEETVRRVQAEWAARESEESPAPAETPSPEPVAASIAADEPASLRTFAGVSETPGDIGRLEAELAQTNRTLRELAARVDSLLATVERLSMQTASAPPRVAQPQDDEWDEAPRVSPITALPPRPAVMRDPTPMTATAQRLVEQPAASAPAPKPSPAPQPAPVAAEPPKRGFDLLPKTYRITVEDKRRGVDLVPLHRALLSMDGVKDMSLLSYNNGVAIVALETTADIQPDTLGTFVSRAMSRPARVEQHNETTMVVKLAED